MRTNFLIKVGAACAALFLLWTLFLMVINSSFSGQLYNPYGNPFGTMRFDRANWLEDEQVTDGGNHRCRMVTVILHHYLATGSREADVVRLLGTPVRYDQKAMKGVQQHPRYFQQGRPLRRSYLVLLSGRRDQYDERNRLCVALSAF